MAHSVLHYAVTKALMEGITGKTKVNIPLNDVEDKYEDVGIAPDGQDLILTVTIITEWDAGESLNVEFEETGDNYGE
jgi:hypothetical protein